MIEAFIGTILCFAGEFAPKGWAICNGSILNINQHQTLYSVLGATYGGDGKSTFALPDLCGRVLLGAGTGAGLTPYLPGAKGGVEAVALNEKQLPAHSHALVASTEPADQTDPAKMALAATTDPATLIGTPIYAKGPATAAMHASSVASAGGSQAHNNMPPYLALNFIICVDGIYPSRY